MRHSNIVTRTLVFRLKSQDILSQFKLKRKFFNLSHCQSKLSNIKSCIVRDEEICSQNLPSEERTFFCLNLSNCGQNCSQKLQNCQAANQIPLFVISGNWVPLFRDINSENLIKQLQRKFCRKIVSAKLQINYLSQIYQVSKSIPSVWYINKIVSTLVG